MRLLNGLLALFLCAAPAIAGTQEIVQFCGQDDTDAGNIIPDCAAKSALNVETNLGGTAISERQGYTQQAALTIGTAPVIGSAYFKDSTGNDIIVVCNNVYCASSKNGASFVNFYSTASIAATQYSFASWNGALYGADNAHDAVWKYDGTNFTNPVNIPACSILLLDQDRMLCSNTTGAPNSVNFSKSGDYTIWAAGVNSPDPFVDFIGTPGDQITGLSYWLGVLYIFKQYSVTACQPGDQYTTSCTQLNAFVGTSDGNSIVQAPDGLYFKGTDQNFWKFDGYNFSITSLRIKTTINTFTSGSTGLNIQTGQAAWQAGTQLPANVSTPVWNTTAIAGSIFPSSTTVSDMTTLQFSSGTVLTNIDTVTVPNSIQITSVTIQDAWLNGVVPAGRLAWTPTVDNQGTFFLNTQSGINFIEAQSTVFSDLNTGIQTSSVTISSGSWKFSFMVFNSGNICSNISVCFSFRYMMNDGGDYYELKLLDTVTDYSNKTLQVNKNVSGASTVLLSTGVRILSYSSSPGNIHTFEVQRSSDGRISFLFDNVYSTGTTFGDVSITSSTHIQIVASGRTNVIDPMFSNFYAYRYVSTATFISREFDTGFSTPTWGPFSSTFTVASNNSDGQVDFYTQVSTSPNNDMWDAKIASSDTIRLTNAQKRYVRYEADLIATSTKTPNVSVVALTAATTGTYVSQCINPPSTISGWGILSCNTTITGNGTLTFYSTSAVNCIGLGTTANLGAGYWTTTANNSNITVATNTAYAFRFDSTLTSSTDTAQVNACTINWKVGTVPPPVWGVYLPQNNAIYWSGDINNSTSTNRTFKYDLNNTSWFPFDLSMQAPLIYKNKLYFGSGNGGFWELYGQGIYGDNGSPVNSFWISKDWNLGEAFQEKSLASVSLVALNQGSGNLTVTQSADGSNPSVFSLSIGTTTTTSYIRDNYLVPVTSPFTFYNVEFSNNAANNPWSIQGYRLDYTLKPWRVLGPP